MTEQLGSDTLHSVMVAAKRGDTDAQFSLGKLYEGRADAIVAASPGGDGNCKEEDAEAVKWYRKAAEQGHAEAQYALGSCYQRSIVDVPLQRLGNVMSNFFTGNPLSLERNINNVMAVRWYRKAAQQMHVRARYELGKMYECGNGVTQDFAEAAKWYLKAAMAGNSDAQFDVGNLFDLGRGVPRDHTEAFKWFSKSAEQGRNQAQHSIGIMYAEGAGVSKDYVQAYMWLFLAETREDDDYGGGRYVEAIRAKDFRESFDYKMTADDVSKAKRLAREWIKAFEEKATN